MSVLFFFFFLSLRIVKREVDGEKGNKVVGKTDNEYYIREKNLHLKSFAS